MQVFIITVKTVCFVYSGNILLLADLKVKQYIAHSIIQPLCQIF